MTNSDLIARVEALEGPDREVDALIAKTVGRDNRQILRHEFGRAPVVETIADAPPHYTASLDAARSLVPHGWRVTHAYWDHKRAHFTLAKDRQFVHGDGSRPEHALCIAALRAQEAQLARQGNE